MERCAYILQKMEGREGDLCDMLLYAVIRLSALAPGLQNTLPATPIHILKLCNPEDCSSRLTKPCSEGIQYQE